MGHKVHPIGFRIGVIRDWQAKWYADKHYAEFLQEDLKLREGIEKRYVEAAVSQVDIERQSNKVSITIYTARPGIVIGRGGQRVDETRAYLEELIGKKVQLNIQEIQRPELDAYLVAKQIAEQIERRVAFRRAMKQTMSRTMQAGARGMRVSTAGRLGGAEIARRLTMHEGQVPLHTLRADIDYGFVEAKTTMGRIGVKVWIYKGDVLPERKEEEAEEVTLEALQESQAEETTEPVTEAAPAVEEKAEEPAAETETAVVEEKVEEPVAEAKEEKPAPAKRTRKKAAEVEAKADEAETKDTAEATEEVEATAEAETVEAEPEPVVEAEAVDETKTVAEAPEEIEPEAEAAVEEVAEAGSAEEEDDSATT